MPESRTSTHFVKRVCIAVAIATVVLAAVALVAWLITGFLILFAGILLSVFLYHLSNWISSLPPAITLFMQMLMGLVAGFLGLFLATPLTAVAVVLVRDLYLRRDFDSGA